jgi:hypothetical protein
MFRLSSLVLLLHSNGDHMVRDVMTLPLRIGACATRFGLRATEQAATLALKAAERLIGVAVPHEPHGAPEGGEATSSLRLDVVIAPPPISETRSSPPPAPPRGVAEAAPEPAPPPPGGGPAPAVTPRHVSEEPQFVEAFAEPGAEEGAGAAVHVEEPWKGYGQMTANEVIARLADASPEELAGVALYEARHRARRTVLTASERQLRRATAAARGRK